MFNRIRLPTLLLPLLIACAGRDSTITHGADGAPEWSRRLAAAVPLGIGADSARDIMTRSGFACRSGTDSVAHMSCDKESSRRVVRRQWQAVIELDAQQHVIAVRGTTRLIER
jgi:hypothetical protein